MHISRLEINNYRNFYQSSMDFEDGLNVIIGPNNSGKSNILNVINYLYSNPNNSAGLHDINKNYLSKKFSEHLEEPPSISIKFFIEHFINFDAPDSAFIKLNKFILYNENGELDAGDEQRYKINAAIEMRYELDSAYLDTYKTAMADANPDSFKSFFCVLKKLEDNFKWNFYNLSQTAFEHKDIKTIFEIELIEASRNIDKIDSKTKDYAALKMTNKKEEVSKLREQINAQMTTTFSDITASINSEIAEDQEMIGIIDGNNKFIGGFDFDSDFASFFKYELEDSKTEYGYSLPVKNNGLGFNNLIHIRNIIKQKKDNDYNILLIEEPESHLHPNMQYKLLKYISGLKERRTSENEAIKNQIIITTHSPNITASTPIANMIIVNYVRDGELSNVVSVRGKNNFDIEYVKKMLALTVAENASEHEKKTNAKFLIKVKGRLAESQKHLQKFLDVTRSDLLFASKVVLVEGLAERLLLPTMAKKLGKERELIHNHISVIEVGGIQFNNFIPMFIGLCRDTVCLRDCDYKYFDVDGKLKNISDYSTYIVGKKKGLLTKEYENYPYVKAFTQKNYGSTFEVELFMENCGNPDAFKYLFKAADAPEALNELIEKGADISSWNSNLDKITHGATKAKVKTLLEKFLSVFDTETDLDNKKIIEKLFFANLFYEYAKERKGDFALEIALDDLAMLNVPEYIKEGLEWLFR